MKLIWGNAYFGVGTEYGRPGICIFGLTIYFYALIIVTGMCLAILIAGLYIKKRGYDPYDITIYALVIIPIGVLGARMYVYIFPWSGQTSNWSTFFDFRSGGLGIYGGVIMGYLAAFVCSKAKKQDFRIIADCIMPGLLLAQSIGRWGNYANQEAYGNLITSEFDQMVNFWGSGRDHGFNGIAVWIENGNQGSGWYQATFFYESVCTFVGFLICVCLLMRSKRYKLGWCSAFYGIYYGIARLVIEGMRTDSLYLYVGTHQTDIKISQLVSIFTIILGVLLLSRIYRKQLHALYRKMFKSEKQELSVSRWVLLGVSVVALGVAITMFVLGGEFKFIVGLACALLSVYSALGIWSLFDRLKLYCNNCGERNLPASGWQTQHSKFFTQTVVYGVACGALLVGAVVSLVKIGIVDGVDNGFVLAIALTVLLGVVSWFKLVPAIKNLRATPVEDFDTAANCQCGGKSKVQLNSFLLFVFPPKVYANYGVEHLKPYVEPESKRKKKRKQKDNSAVADTDKASAETPSQNVTTDVAQNQDADGESEK